MSHDSVTCQKAGHIAYLTINRPHVLNAMDITAHEALSEHLDRCESDNSVRAVVLTGAGDRAFSAGRDLKALAEENEMNGAEKLAFSARWAKIRRLTDRFDFYKPLVARVNGLALGGGFELALACDIIIAADNATFAFPEPKRGFLPLAGGVHRLPRQLPLKIAMGQLMTGRQMTSERAYALGLINAIARPNDLDTEVARWIADILACSPLALRAIKQCVALGLNKALPEAMTGCYPLQVQCIGGRDAVEGPRAFVEKRSPVWTEL